MAKNWGFPSWNYLLSLFTSASISAPIERDWASAPTFSVALSGIFLVESSSLSVSGFKSMWFGSGFDSISVTCTLGIGIFGALV